MYLPWMDYQSKRKGKGRLCYSNSKLWILLPALKVNCSNSKIEKLIMATLERTNITKWKTNAKLVRSYSKSSLKGYKNNKECKKDNKNRSILYI